MTTDYKRTDRVAGVIQRRLAEIIQTQIKDPRLPSIITVSAVKVSPDLHSAKVYVTVLGKDNEKDVTLEILTKAAGFLRSTLARSIKLRVVPHLQFVYDESIEYGSKLRRLIDDVMAESEPASLTSQEQNDTE